MKIQYNWSKHRILVADDDRYCHLLLDKILKKTGAEVIHAYSGTQALNVLQSDSKITLALLDIIMPGLTGFQVADKISQFNNDLILIAYTANVVGVSKEKCMKHGFANCLIKPVLPSKLLSTIQESLLVNEIL